MGVRSCGDCVARPSRVCYWGIMIKTQDQSNWGKWPSWGPIVSVVGGMIGRTLKSCDRGLPAYGEFVSTDNLLYGMFRAMKRVQRESENGGTNGNRADFALGDSKERRDIQDTQVTDGSVGTPSSIQEVNEVL